MYHEKFYLSNYFCFIKDSTFSSDGIVTTDFAPGYDVASAIGIQADGKIVVAGTNEGTSSESQFALARYFIDGSLDTNFGNAGKVLTNFGLGFDQALSLVIQPDGKILLAGYATEAGYSFALARYDTNGSLDTTFNSTGKVITDMGGSQDWIQSVILQPDGKTVVAGYDNGNFGLARYNTNGLLDTTFDFDGKVSTSFGSLNDWAYSVAIQQDGKIVASGLAYNSITGVDFALARYDTTGALDTTFDNDGKATFDLSNNSFDEGHAMVIQPDGKILLAGNYSTNADKDFAIIRVNANGSLDTSFGNNGIARFNITNVDDYCNAIALQTDGKILMTGTIWFTSTDEIGMIRLNSNGTIDNTFGNGGIIITHINNIYDEANAVTFQTDGKILIGGYTEYPGGISDFAVLRYNNDIQTSFIDFSVTDLPILIYPNPVKDLASIQYTLNENDKITISLLDMNGRTVQTFFKDKSQQKGMHEEHLYFNKRVSSGAYLLSISNSQGIPGVTIKIILE